MDAYKVKKYFMVSGQSIIDVTPLRFFKVQAALVILGRYVPLKHLEFWNRE